MATIQNFFVKRGDSFRQKITVTMDGVVVNITGWTIYFTLKEKKADEDKNAIIKKNITEHINPTTGESLLLVLPEETRTLLGDYYYDIQVKRPIAEPLEYDDIQTPIEGKITFSEDVTIRVNSDE
jgi:hypothetical protein